MTCCGNKIIQKVCNMNQNNVEILKPGLNPNDYPSILYTPPMNWPLPNPSANGAAEYQPGAAPRETGANGDPALKGRSKHVPTLGLPFFR